MPAEYQAYRDPRLRPQSRSLYQPSRSGSYDHPPARDARPQPRPRPLRDDEISGPGTDIAPYGRSTTYPPPRPRVVHPPLPRQRRRQRSPERLYDGHSPDYADNMSRRSKRRKLDSEDTAEWRPPIKYGRFGQVEPGRLKLEIISCDGGEHKDVRHPSTSLAAQNLLRHDKSVYCSERPTSSIVFRHADDTPLCLEKLHIVGPEHGFTAPVREGVVYIAMNFHDLNKYTDPPFYARRVHHQDRRQQRRSTEQISLVDALRDPEVTAALDQQERELGYRNLAEDHYDEDFGPSRGDPEPHCELLSTADAEAADEDRHLPVTLLNDEEPGEEDSTSQDVLDFRLQRLRYMGRRIEVENWGREDHDRDNGWSLRHLDAMMARQRMSESPIIDLHDEHDLAYLRRHDEPKTNTMSETREYHDHGLNDPNVTRARFHIRRGNHKVAISFDPPVSGRFILVKLWAHKSNVDVQSVIAKGFGSARFFPAIDFR